MVQAIQAQNAHSLDRKGLRAFVVRVKNEQHVVIGPFVIRREGQVES